MNAKLSRLLLAVGTTITLAASAVSADAAVVARWGDAKFKPVHAGLTQDEVRGLIGSPVAVLRNERPGVTMWTYNYTDTFGYNEEFDVSFDASGKVVGTDSLRPKN
jgi:hypothetical protein